MIADRVIVDAIADGDDDSGAFVAQHQRQRIIECVPLVADKSLWQTPQAAMRTVTSPCRGAATSICSTKTGLPTSRARTAFAN